MIILKEILIKIHEAQYEIKKLFLIKLYIIANINSGTY